MTQEQKDILLRDLCGRLPYGVIVKDRNGIHKLTIVLYMCHQISLLN